MGLTPIATTIFTNHEDFVMTAVALATIPVESTSVFEKPLEDKYVGVRHSLKQIKLYMAFAKNGPEHRAIRDLSGVGQKKVRKTQ